jgi:hypothetical protein
VDPHGRNEEHRGVMRFGHHREADLAALRSGVAKPSVSQPSLKLLLVSQWCDASDGGKGNDGTGAANLPSV